MKIGISYRSMWCKYQIGR